VRAASTVDLMGERERWWQRREVGLVAVGLATGLVAGVWAAERGRFVDWLLDTEWDWSTLPSEFFGAGMATLAGILISVRMTERSAARQRDKLEAETAQENTQRQQAWEDLYVAVRPLRSFVLTPPEPVASQLRAIGDGDAGLRGETRNAAERVAEHVCCRAQWRQHLPDVLTQMHKLIDLHDVYALTVPNTTLHRLSLALGIDALWIPADVDADELLGQIAVGQAPKGSTLISPAGRSFTALVSLADRHRRHPVGRDLDASGSRRIGDDMLWPARGQATAPQYTTDSSKLLEPFGDLADALRDLPEPL
jgi:hypothetical protein